MTNSASSLKVCVHTSPANHERPPYQVGPAKFLLVQAERLLLRHRSASSEETLWTSLTFHPLNYIFLLLFPGLPSIYQFCSNFKGLTDFAWSYKSSLQSMVSTAQALKIIIYWNISSPPFSFIKILIVNLYFLSHSPNLKSHFAERRVFEKK